MEKEELEVKDEPFIPKTKNKGLKIILAIILIAGLIVGGYFLYQKKFNDPKTIISNAFEDARKELKESFKEVNDNNIYKLDGHLKVDSNITDDEIGKALTLLKDIELQFSGEIDTEKSIGNLELNSKYKNDKLIAIKGYYENDIAYLLLENIYDKYIKLDLKEMQKEINITETTGIDVKPSDIETIVDSLITAAKKELLELDYKKDNAKITIDEKEIEVIDNYVELKNNEVNELAKKIIEDLKKDQKFVEVIAKLAGMDGNKVLEEIAKEIDQDEFKGSYKINFYTEKGLLTKKLVSIKQTITQDNVETILTTDRISDDEELFTVSMNGAIITVRVKKNNSVMNMIVNVNIMGKYVKVEFNTNYEKIKEVTKVDVSNSINANELTQQDEQAMEEKLMQNKTLMQLMEEINKLS